MKQSVLDRVAAATVRFPRGGGQGVLVRGNFIVTAAHVIRRNDLWRGTGFYEPRLERIELGGRKLRVDVYAVEFVEDVAVLGVPDPQAFEDAVGTQEFDAFVRNCPDLVASRALFVDFARNLKKLAALADPE